MAEVVHIGLDSFDILRVFNTHGVPAKETTTIQNGLIIKAIRKECKTCTLRKDKTCKGAFSIGGQAEILDRNQNSIRKPDCPANDIVVGI